jgi:tetratricopeptide (TPR) repeat protein
MDDRLYRFLKWTAIIMAAAWLGWAVYENFFLGKQPGEYKRAAASRSFSDGDYQQALDSYDEALRVNPDLSGAQWGRAETLIMLNREYEAVQIYDELIAQQPDVAANYANRGIALDRMGQYAEALASYETAISLDAETGDGPHWLTRLLRNQPDKPPGIADRAAYLREQLALPAEDRLLRVPEVDDAQRPYKE